MGGPRTRRWLQEAGDLPRRWRCTARRHDEYDGYDPGLYRLAEADDPPPLERFLADLELRGGAPLRPAEGLVWSHEEFLDQQWVDEWIADGAEGEFFRDSVIGRYGEKIPADLAILDAHAHDFLGIETADREASWVHERHVTEFAGLDDLREALHLMHQDGWLTTLDDGTVIAPRLRLIRAR